MSGNDSALIERICTHMRVNSFRLKQTPWAGCVVKQTDYHTKKNVSLVQSVGKSTKRILSADTFHWPNIYYLFDPELDLFDSDFFINDRTFSAVHGFGNRIFFISALIMLNVKVQYTATSRQN